MFKFDQGKEFDKHIRKSIPCYNELQSMIRRYAEFFIQEGTNVYDVGCSTGKLLRSFPVFDNVGYIGIDNSFDNKNRGQYKYDTDLDCYPFYNASFVTSVFTLQFLPDWLRAQVLQSIYDGMNEGGAFIVCEKLYSQSPKLQSLSEGLQYEFKLGEFNGTDILLKEQDLRSNMRIKSFSHVCNELSDFGEVDTFWQMGNFTAFIVIKGDRKDS